MDEFVDVPSDTEEEGLVLTPESRLVRPSISLGDGARSPSVVSAFVRRFGREKSEGRSDVDLRDMTISNESGKSSVSELNSLTPPLQNVRWVPSLMLDYYLDHG